jgi:Holliday junction resolvase RusA-like endonuclease
MYDPGTAEAWKSDVARAFEGIWAGAEGDRKKLDGPVRIAITFLFPRPKCLMRLKDPDGRMPHAKKPDRDNCEKAVTDCLTRLGVWTDDGQVCAGEVVKLYAGKSEQAGAEIRISILEDAQ